MSKDYFSMTREELVQQLRQLEARLAAAERPGGDTGAKSSAAALRDSEERMRAVLQTAVEAIITIDEQGIIETVNPAAEKLFGYRADEMTGRNVSLLMPSPHRELHDQYLANYRQTGVARIIGIGREVVGQRKDGSTFPMDLSVGEVRLAGGRMFVGIIRDITARKQAEDKLAELAATLVEKNKELETIVYVASHDLRSPLVNIQGFSKELAKTCERLQEVLPERGGALDQAEAKKLLAEDVPESVDYILAGVAKIDTLLSGFLRFSRLGRAALKIERLNMQKLIEKIVRAMEFQIQQANAVVEVGPLPDCQGDGTQINHVFSNLLDNALKYRAPERRLEVRISGREEGGRAVYAVADNGIGIAPEHQGKIFEIFHRLNPGRGEGEGLGLTIAQRILERQNGRIWLESAAGTGSRFFVALPAVLTR